jgi:hypothetical protein
VSGSKTREVPWTVYKHLQGAFVAHWADWLLRYVEHLGGYKPGETVLHPGDPFGTVLAWLWEDRPDQVAVFIADYMAELRVHNELVDPDKPLIRFEDVLQSLRLALPGRFQDTEALVAHLRAEVPQYYGSDDLNT